MARGSGSGQDGITVTEKGKSLYSGHGVAPSDSNAMSDTPPPTARWGQEAPEVITRHDPSGSAVPDIRKAARSAAEVEKERPRELPGWVGPLVGVITFVLVMGAGIVFMVMWFAYLAASKPPPPPEPEVPEHLEGVPVRKGIGEGE